MCVTATAAAPTADGVGQTSLTTITIFPLFLEHWHAPVPFTLWSIWESGDISDLRRISKFCTYNYTRWVLKADSDMFYTQYLYIYIP